MGPTTCSAAAAPGCSVGRRDHRRHLRAVQLHARLQLRPREDDARPAPAPHRPRPARRPGNQLHRRSPPALPAPASTAPPDGRLECDAGRYLQTLTNMGRQHPRAPRSRHARRAGSTACSSYGRYAEKISPIAPSARDFEGVVTPIGGSPHRVAPARPRQGSCNLGGHDLGRDPGQPGHSRPASGGATKCWASAVDDPGWFYEYGDTCPVEHVETSPPARTRRPDPRRASCSAARYGMDSSRSEPSPDPIRAAGRWARRSSTGTPRTM